MAVPQTPENLAANRPEQVGCVLRVGVVEIPAVTTNVRPTGLDLRVVRPEPEEIIPPPGTQISYRLLLPSREALIGVATIAWVQRQDSGLHELGLEITHRTDREALDAFLRTFRHTILAVDGDEHALQAARATLGGEYRVLTCRTAGEAVRLLQSTDLAALVIAEQLVDTDALCFLREHAAAVSGARAAVIVSYGGTLGDQSVQELIGLGQVFHFLRKPFRASDLLQVCRRGIDAHTLLRENDRLTLDLERIHRRLQRENRVLRRRLELPSGLHDIVGSSPAIRDLLSEVAAVSQTDTTVHIHGETGSGKELVARALHAASPRATKPFVAQNCAGFSESLLQSILFGHRKGAFTGADRDHPGVFEQAHGGTLFLDEVAELAMPVQGALLRALQEGEITPVGAQHPVHVDVRLVSATHADLRQRVTEGRFREDLFYRLVVLSVRVPPLRDREGDIAVLAHHFLARFCREHHKHLKGFEPAAMAALQRYAWPGNVRELENEVERVVVLADGGELAPLDLLSAEVQAQGTDEPAQAPGESITIGSGLSYDQSVEALQRHLISRALALSHGNISAAARLLGIDRSRLGKLKARLQLDDPDEGSGP